jgi:hypothetical protein
VRFVFARRFELVGLIADRWRCSTVDDTFVTVGGVADGRGVSPVGTIDDPAGCSAGVATVTGDSACSTWVGLAPRSPRVMARNDTVPTTAADTISGVAGTDRKPLEPHGTEAAGRGLGLFRRSL